jgi:hypothetical protein
MMPNSIANEVSIYVEPVSKNCGCKKKITEEVAHPFPGIEQTARAERVHVGEHRVERAAPPALVDAVRHHAKSQRNHDLRRGTERDTRFYNPTLRTH